MWVRRCRLCGKDLPLEDFTSNPLNADTLSSNCKACGGVDVKDWLTVYFETPERHYELGAAAIAHNDVERVEYYIGRYLKDANILYPTVLRKIVTLLTEALDNLDRKSSEGIDKSIS